MLHSISWSEFLTTIIASAAIYYTAVLVIYYRADIIRLTARKHPNESPPTQPSSMLMGKIKHQSHPAPIEQIATEEIKFQPPTQELRTSSTNDPNTLLIGTIADLLQDINNMTEVVQGTPKEEVVSMFKSVLSRYPSIVGTSYQQAISLHLDTILSEYGFPIDASETATWWPQTNASN